MKMNYDGYSDLKRKIRKEKLILLLKGDRGENLLDKLVLKHTEQRQEKGCTLIWVLS
jgi:DNA-binding MurR/RpiR family transcriptional regulator